MTPETAITIFTSQAKIWMPVLGFISFLYGIYRSANKKVNAWANKLMGNHMVHLQQSLDRLEAAQNQQLDHSAVQSDQLIAQTELLRQVVYELRTPAAIAPAPRKRANFASVKMKK